MTHYTLKALPCGRCGERWAILDLLGRAHGVFRNVLAAEARRLQLERAAH